VKEVVRIYYKHSGKKGGSNKKNADQKICLAGSKKKWRNTLGWGGKSKIYNNGGEKCFAIPIREGCAQVRRIFP